MHLIMIMICNTKGRSLDFTWLSSMQRSFLEQIVKNRLVMVASVFRATIMTKGLVCVKDRRMTTVEWNETAKYIICLHVTAADVEIICEIPFLSRRTIMASKTIICEKGRRMWLLH